MKRYDSEEEWFERAMRVDQVMTPLPLTIASHVSLDHAKEVMASYNISHLPVLARGELAGLVSHQDLLSASEIYGSSGLMVRYAMRSDPYTVASDDSFADVLTEMIERKIGSALVVGNGGALIGIFTVNDALHMLRALVMLGARGRDYRDLAGGLSTEQGMGLKWLKQEREFNEQLG